jgi:hypothetical protein
MDKMKTDDTQKHIDVSTKNSEPTYWTILFVMLKIYFIYKVAGKKIQKGYIKFNYVVCLSDTCSSCHGVTYTKSYYI